MSQQSTPTANKLHVSQTRDEGLQPSEDLVQYLKDYARAKPDVAALWCFGLGFIVGWKLKPW